MNICVFGDSVAKGIVFDEKLNRYSRIKNNFIEIVHQRTGIDFTNFARFGCTTEKGKTIMDRQEDALRGYDIAILEFGGNDCDLNWKEVAESPGSDHVANVPIERFRTNYEYMIERVMAAGCSPVLLTLPPLCAGSFFDWVSRGLDRQGILTYLNNDVDYIFDWHQSYNRMVYTISREMKVPVIDIRRAFLNRRSYDRYMCIDGMHPNEEGHRILAGVLEKFITKKESLVF